MHSVLPLTYPDQRLVCIRIFKEAITLYMAMHIYLQRAKESNVNDFVPSAA